jgi:serine/threonine-protein kinase
MERHLSGVWDPMRAGVVRAAFARTGNPRASETADRVIPVLDAYSRNWVAARRRACEATHVHGDQSAELLDMRVACLDRNLLDARAVVDNLATASKPALVDKSLSAALRLSPPSDCDDTEALRTIVQLPRDPATRTKVEQVSAELASAKALGDLGQVKAGLARAKDATASAEKLGYRPLVAEALGRRGRLEELAGDPRAAEETLKQAIIAAADAHDDPRLVILWGHLLFMIAEPLQRPADALRLVPAAQAAAHRAGSNRATVANQEAIIARVLIANGQFAVGHEMLQKALAVKEELTGKNSFEVARELGAIGNVLQDLGKYDESLVYLERALGIWKRTFGSEHPDVIKMEANIANAYESKGNFEEARRRHEHVLALAIKLLGPEHPIVAGTYTNLGNALLGLERFDDAIDILQRAIALHTKVLGATHANVAMSRVSLAMALRGLHRYEEARTSLEQAIDAYTKLDMADHPLDAFALETLALTLRDLGRPAEAIAPAERSLKIRLTSEAGPDLVAGSRLTLGSVLLAAGRDRTRGHALVTEARAFYVTYGEDGKRYVKEADAVLAKHPQ